MPRHIRGRVVTLRVALLLVLAAGLWLGWRVDRARRQERAIAAIRGAGGSVVFDEDLSGAPEVPGALGRALADARGWIGDAYFREVVQVHFSGATDDAGLAEVAGRGGLGEFDRLETLILMNTNVGDEGLRRLGAMTRVRTLYLGGSKVTDRGMAYLKGWTRLEDLGVSFTQVGDPGMKLLDGLPLTGLGARQTRISPAEFSRISKAHPKLVIRY